VTSIAEDREDRNSLGKAAFIIGLIALILSFVPIIGFVAWLMAPLAILFGLIALRRKSKSLAIAGIITGAFALVICFTWVSGTKAVGDAMNRDTFNTTGETADLSNAPIVETSVKGLWKEIEDNKLAAGKKYGGKRLAFSDEAIEDFGGDTAAPSIQFLGNTDGYMNYFVNASFDPADGEAIAGHSKGDKVSFVCNSIKESFGDGYNLNGCKLT
jgi:hypothetical protein